MAETKRRARGKHSIYYDRSRDRWTGTITVGWKPDGRRDRITVRGRTKTEVKDKLRAKHQELTAGVRTPANFMVAQCLKDWLETLNTQAESTVTGYRIMVRHLAGLIGTVKLVELKVRDVDFALGKLAERLSTRSVRLARMILIQAIRNAMVNDLVVRNVADLAAVPTGKPGRPSRSLNLEQALAVLDAAQGERLWPYVAVSMLGGIRTEEARALRWSQVDLEVGTVAIYRSVRRTGETKTEKSRRVFQIPEIAVDALRELVLNQAEDLFAEYGVPVQPGKVASTAEEARDIAAEFAAQGHPLVVVKAQVKTGGRGKAGGVKLANGPDEAYEKASQILGMDIKGHTVHTVLIAQAVDIAAEYYLSFLLDRANRTFLSICSVQGGMEIEEVAHSSPDAVARIPVSPLTGVDAGKAQEIIAAGRIPAEAAEGAALLAERLWAMFADEDATLVEVNPLALTEDGAVLAVDGKVTLDDNAAFRQEHARFDDVSNTDPIEARAREKHLNYVKLDGEVGIIGNGAGLVMSTLDVVAYAGQSFGGIKPANFLDIGGGASAEVMANGLEIVLSDPSVRSVFVNVFGGITACDAVANGIVSAIGMLEGRGDHVDRPIVVRLDGNNAAEGRRILQEALIPVVEQVATMDGAARRSAELASTAAKGA